MLHQKREKNCKQSVGPTSDIRSHTVPISSTTIVNPSTSGATVFSIFTWMFAKTIKVKFTG